MARIIYAEISSLCNANGFCTAKNATIAKNFDIDPRSVSRYISELEKLEFIWLQLETTPIGTKRKIWVDKSVMGRQICRGGVDKSVVQNNTSNNKEKKEATTDVVEEHKALIKKIAAYLDSKDGKVQIDYWMQTAMFKGDIQEAIEDFTNYWWGEGNQMFKNNPVSFLNKKLVSWLKRRKKSPQRQSKTASKAIEKESIEAYVDNTHGKKQRSLKKYYKEKYFNIEAFKAFSPSIKQTAFEFDMLHGKLQDSKPTKMRKANFKKFYQSLTDNQRKFADSVELYNKYLMAI